MASLHPFRALRPTPDKRRGGLVRSLRRREHRRSAPAGRRQSAEFSARHPVGDRSAAGHRSVLVRRSTTRRARTSRRFARARRWCVEETPVALFLSPADGGARADRHRRMLLGRRVRVGRHQETRAHAARQGRRSHAAHRRAARADRRRVPDLSAPTAAVDATRAARHGRASRCTISPPPTACATPSGAPAATQIRRAGRRPSARFRRSTSRTVITAPPARHGRERAAARRVGRRCRRRQHVHRGGVP